MLRHVMNRRMSEVYLTCDIYILHNTVWFDFNSLPSYIYTIESIMNMANNLEPVHGLVSAARSSNF